MNQFLVRSSTVQYSTVQYSTVQYSTVQYSTVQYSTVQYSTVQYSTVQYSTVQYSTVQYSTVQYSTVQYNKIQYSTTTVHYHNSTVPQRSPNGVGKAWSGDLREVHEWWDRMSVPGITGQGEHPGPSRNQSSAQCVQCTCQGSHPPGYSSLKYILTVSLRIFCPPGVCCRCTGSNWGIPGHLRTRDWIENPVPWPGAKTRESWGTILGNSGTALRDFRNPGKNRIDPAEKDVTRQVTILPLTNKGVSPNMTGNPRE